MCEEDHAAVRYGDLILKADGSEISSSEALNQIVMSKSVGDTVDLLVYRNRKKITVTITVSEVIPDALESTS